MKPPPWRLVDALREFAAIVADLPAPPGRTWEPRELLDAAADELDALRERFVDDEEEGRW